MKQRLHPSVERIARPKRLLLLRRIAGEIGWPDAKLHDELEQGFKLTGMASASGVFRPDPRPASLSEEELYSKAKFLKPLLLGKISAQKVDDLAAAVYELTCDEAADAKGWLDGPYTPAQIGEKLGTQTWIPLRRFGVSQKDKIRPVDDCSENNVNDAFTSVESISLGAMDHIVWSALTLCRHCVFHHSVDLRLSDGTRLAGKLHADWVRLSTSFKATAFDLKSAHKQLPVAPCDVSKAVVSLVCPGDGQPRCFLMRALPFGAKAAVAESGTASVGHWVPPPHPVV